MAMVVIVVLVTQDAFVGSADPVAAFIIMDCAEQAFPAAPDLMPMLIIMVGIPQQRGAAVSDLMATPVIMIDPVRQDALAAEDLLHGITSPFRKDGAGRALPHM